MSKIEEILKYVSEHNEFYQNIIKEYGITDPTDIAQYPILTREQLQKNRYNMFSDGYKSKYYLQKLRRKSSSGSTGMPVNIYWDHIGYYHSMLPLWRYTKKYYGITPFSKKVSFSLVSFDKKNAGEILFSNDNNILDFNWSCAYNVKQLKQIAEIIHQFQPEWIYAPPSILQLFLQCCKSNKTPPINSLKYIESIGEMLSLHLKEELKDFFGVPVANMYGSEEHNCIAYECPYGHMHILNENVKVEVMKNGVISDNESGEAIITNLNNYTMPLIRYNQGDDINLMDQNYVCPCGNTANIIKIINGRQRDIVYEGEYIISPFFLNEVIAETQNQYNDPIIHYFFKYYTHKKQLEAWIEIDPCVIKWETQIKENLKKNFYYKLNGVTNILFEVYVGNDLNSSHYLKGKHKIIHVED